MELTDGDNVDHNYPKDGCCVCLGGRAEKTLFMCQGCQRLFHADCMGVREHEAPNRSWQCQICVCKKQLIVLQSYCKSQSKDNGKKNNSKACDPITKVEIVQQLLLNHLQDSVSADDVHLFVRWFVHEALYSLFVYLNRYCREYLFFLVHVQRIFVQVLFMLVVQG